MMYDSIDQLPSDIRERMPDDACEIYRAAYNRLREKESATGLVTESRLHERAHDGAILAVQSEFEIDDKGNWHRASIGDSMERIGQAASNEAQSVVAANDDK